jgi:hypothetical protein
VRDADGDTIEVYDGQEDYQFALIAAEEHEGATVWALDYVSDGQYRRVVCEHDYDTPENGCRICTVCGKQKEIRR